MKPVRQESHPPSVPTKGESPRMFDRIAHRYDLINRVLTLRLDVGWRRTLAKALPDHPNLALLDVATGTGDILIFSLQRRPNITLGVGVDVAARMMQFGITKAARQALLDRISFVQGDALHMPFADRSFDATTISFGIRNVTDVPTALREMHRVLKPGGKTLILEFSIPRNPLIRPLYLAYLRHVLPRIGGFISGDAIPYHYLDTTVESFPYGEEFCAYMTRAGFIDVHEHRLTFGIATIYSGFKK